MKIGIRAGQRELRMVKVADLHRRGKTETQGAERRFSKAAMKNGIGLWKNAGACWSSTNFILIALFSAVTRMLTAVQRDLLVKDAEVIRFDDGVK